MSKDECEVADWRVIGFEDGASGKSSAAFSRHRKSCSRHGISPDHQLYQEGFRTGNQQFCTDSRGYQVGQSGQESQPVCAQAEGYQAGYERGIQAFCSYDRGFEHSSHGKRLLPQCPLDSAYQLGYEQGLIDYCTFDNGYEAGTHGWSVNVVCPSDLEGGFLRGYREGTYVHNLLGELESLEYALDEVLHQREKVRKHIGELKNRITYGANLSAEERANLLDELQRLTKHEADKSHYVKELHRDIAEIEYELERHRVSLPRSTHY